jgi:ATP-dependent Clp protease protease subunit
MERISEDTERDFYMSSVEAKDYGIIDEIILREGVSLPLDRKDIDLSEYF